MEERGPETFEEAFSRAEKAVENLEKGDLPLEQCLRQYEEGFRALKHCYGLLELAQRKVEVLTGSGDSAPRFAREDDAGDTHGGADTAGSDANTAGWRDASSVPSLEDALGRIDRARESSEDDD